MKSPIPETGPIRDRDRHVWPRTGHVCRGCGWPLSTALASIGLHPNCDEPPKQRPTT